MFRLCLFPIMSQGPNTVHGMCKGPAHLILDQANVCKFLILSILWRVKGGVQAASSRPFITVNTSIMLSVVTHQKSKTGRWNTKRLVIEVLTCSSINFSQNGMKSVGERKKIIWKHWTGKGPGLHIRQFLISLLIFPQPNYGDSVVFLALYAAFCGKQRTLWNATPSSVGSCLAAH